MVVCKSMLLSCWTRTCSCCVLRLQWHIRWAREMLIWVGLLRILLLEILIELRLIYELLFSLCVRWARRALVWADLLRILLLRVLAELRLAIGLRPSLCICGTCTRRTLVRAGLLRVLLLKMLIEPRLTIKRRFTWRVRVSVDLRRSALQIGHLGP